MNRASLTIWKSVTITVLFAITVRLAIGSNLSALELGTGVVSLTVSFLLLFGTLGACGGRRKGLGPPNIAVLAALLSRILAFWIPLSKRLPSEKIRGQSDCYGESPDRRTDGEDT